jgi:hypothetical protein
MFWLAFGTASAVIGLALMTIGATRSASGASLLDSAWFDAGLGLLALGALLLLWALWLYLARRRRAALQLTAGSGTDAQLGQSHDGKQSDAMTEAVRGYYAEREKLMKMWDDRERDRRSRPDE